MLVTDISRLAVMALYFLGAALYFGGFFRRSRALKDASFAATLVGLVLHTGLLALATLDLAGQPFSQVYFIKLLSWMLVAALVVLWRRKRQEFLALTAAPLAFLLFTASVSLPADAVKMPPTLVGPFFGLHIGSLFISFGLLAMAFGAGLLFLHVEGKIKAKERLEGFRQDLPSLSAFDRINHVAVMVGFPLYTLGMVSGFLWAKLTWGRVITWDPKEVVSLCVWLGFAYLFQQRLAGGWRGRKPAKWAVVLFAVAVVSLMGVNYFLPTHHSFTGQEAGALQGLGSGAPSP